MIKMYIQTTTPKDAVNWRRFTHMGIVEHWDVDGDLVHTEKFLATSREQAREKLDNTGYTPDESIGWVAEMRQRDRDYCNAVARRRMR